MKRITSWLVLMLFVASTAAFCCIYGRVFSGKSTAFKKRVAQIGNNAGQ